MAGRAMVQVVGRRPLAAKVQDLTRVSPSGICGEKGGAGTGFSRSSSVFFPVSIIPPWLSIHIII
jgi:hypothetical protein